MVCFAVLVDQNNSTVYSNLAGRYPLRSYSGMDYIFVLHIYSMNAILIQPMKTRSDACIVDAFKDIYAYLATKGLTPKLQVLDNECS